ncbi:hypothetical protein AGMMS49587_15230 [Spirochaetia bacterium]|nr:hypothetical protein AGMMS49587_15230 [Spirochaetia bacterium]
MDKEDRQLLIENLSEMRELRGEMREFKEHVMGRVERLEKKAGEQSSNLKSTLALIISTGMLAVNIIINFFRHGGK